MMIREAIAALVDGRSLTEAEAAAPYPRSPGLGLGGRVAGHTRGSRANGREQNNPTQGRAEALQLRPCLPLVP